jgi:hypothetical protein
MFVVGLDKMTEKAAPDDGHSELTLKELATSSGNVNIQPPSEIQDPDSPDHNKPKTKTPKSPPVSIYSVIGHNKPKTSPMVSIYSITN